MKLYNTFKKIVIAILACMSAELSAQMPTIKYETINQKKIAYYEEGNGQETLVLLHGWPQTSYVWRKMIPDLAKNYRVIAIDLPGLGKSESIENYSTDNVASILNAFLHAKEINKIHLIGHDLGTWVAMSYTLKYENEISSLTLMDAGIPGLMNANVFQPENADKIWQFYFHSIDDLPEFLVSNNIKEYFDWYFNKKSFIKNSINIEDRKIYVKAYKSKNNLKAGFDYYRAYKNSSEFNKLNIRKLNVPILAIGGEFALGKNVGLALEPYSEKLTTVSLNESGHYIPEEQPKKLIELIKQFIKTNQ